jgi:outer membrane protein OmpA-like peptidoglycan-associated protein
MKNLLSLFAVILAVSLPSDLLAQTPSADPQAIELTADDLKTMVRKMADLRRQRILAWQQQQMRIQRQAAQRRQRAQNIAGEPAEKPSAEVVENSVLASASTDNAAEMAEIRRRLDRQEELLMDIRDRSLVAPAPLVPIKSDTVVQQIIQRQQTETGLDEEEQQTLANEISRMNTELNSLRRRLADEEDRRHRAELETERIRSNSGAPRSDSWRQEQLRYERDLNRRRAEEQANRNRDRAEQRNNERLRYERELREEERNGAVSPAAPVIVTNEESVRIIRDTVIVDRISTTPVFIEVEGATDTMVIIKETIREVAPEVVNDTVLVEREREIVRTDTLQLEATEPISFPTIFFDNNSSQLNAAHRNLIATAVNQLRGKTNYNLRLTGFASPSGNATANQQLSAKRADAVRQGFENAGMDADRIVIVPGGIDFKPSNAAAARRVEVQAFPR